MDEAVILVIHIVVVIIVDRSGAHSAGEACTRTRAKEAADQGERKEGEGQRGRDEGIWGRRREETKERESFGSIEEQWPTKQEEQR